MLAGRPGRLCHDGPRWRGSVLPLSSLAAVSMHVGDDRASEQMHDEVRVTLWGREPNVGGSRTSGRLLFS